jgi:UDP-3-O-[3-hydroxymyristoyl] glucosamine N-acyltransferase
VYRLKDIATFIDAELIGDASIKINSLATSFNAQKDQLTYIASNKYKADLLDLKAGAVIITKDLLEDCPTNALVGDNVYLAFAQLTHFGLNNDIIPYYYTLFNYCISANGAVFTNHNMCSNSATTKQIYWT